ncbi:thiamine pyrophosphate-dependent acetolactate synthase large subunit-like protein [Lipingzhangella halophila]|uniref:Thiamine pyrophosphate-dependent acetolactate synthase large subunit-like protein n=1 Tax=Lipingzhangella halophila TaxID=1783352 RepID=A0A7W7RFU7_9ACTN|nr:thiamine pyrophosphate-binding protein [Lipingzhangella halophila]MBB4931221.1 thiamine pyrophosphate-dependent acetolactate synthase large subunit-like protein [Lipingzhangella halophila]
MRVAEAVARELARLGIDQVFGVVGSGNFHVTNALVAAGARFVATRHEAGAATMADAHARTTGAVAAVTVHQGCGLTNALTAITEAAKSRTPLLVLSADTAASDLLSNFHIDQPAVLNGLGVATESITSPATAVRDATRAFRRAAVDRRTVVLNLPLDIQEAPVPLSAVPPVPPPARSPARPEPAAVASLAELLRTARSPVFVAGRGARLAGAAGVLSDLAEHSGALLATSAVARGMFADHPWSIDVAGGFASPLTADLLREADLVVAWGASLNSWTLRNGELLSPDASVVQIDDDTEALAVHTRVDLALLGDVGATARAALEEVRERPRCEPSWRTPDLRESIAQRCRWRDVPFTDTSTEDTIDPRTLTIALDDVLPRERVVAPDGGNFNGYPAMFLGVPDARGFCLTLAFASIGLGVATAIGAGLASPGRVAVAGVGDGGFMMSHVELNTAVRMEVPLIVVVYNDHAYGAEVHHFAPHGYATDIVEFPETDIARIARGHGCEAVTVRTLADLKEVERWVDGSRRAPLVIDARITSFPSWLIDHAFAADAGP